jgi:CRISPR-associated endonuclease Cas1
MNALWLNKILYYKNSTYLLKTCKNILSVKIDREIVLAKKYKKLLEKEGTLEEIKSLEELFLYEARSAKKSWKIIKELLPKEYGFKGRVQHGEDVTNKLLDIGFHHLATIVKKSIESHSIPPEIGFFHKAHSSKSTPLVYDTMEMFRSDIVVSTVLSFLRQKKKILKTLEQKDIAKFIYQINKKLEKKFYIKEFVVCQTYLYYIDLQILRLIKAVNSHTVFNPVVLPKRHETRCQKKFDKLIK